MPELTKFKSKHKKYLVCDTTDFFCPVEVYAESFYDAALKVAKVWEKQYDWQPDESEWIMHIEMLGYSSYEKGRFTRSLSPPHWGNRYPLTDYETLERMSYL